MALNLQSNVGFCKCTYLKSLYFYKTPNLDVPDKAPVCKSLLVYVGCSHAATHIPSLAPIFRKVFSGVNTTFLLHAQFIIVFAADAVGVESPQSLLRLLASKLIFPDTRSAILSCFLIYFFRILERRSGSLKFSSHLAVR